MKTLLGIGEDIRALADLLEENTEGTGGEITPETDKIIDEWLSQVEGDRDCKLDSYGRLIRENELLAAAREEEAERLRKGASAKRNLAKKLKERLMMFMGVTGEKRIETPHFRFTVCNNGGKAPLDIAVSPETLPPAFQMTQVVADVDLIRKCLECGGEVPGCRILPRGTHLRIA